ncbi:MAG: GIY-YIG nuclease family protein [Hahellaceae bacterium]|nr:GIY-YIG nuclease family protein [Hahellaceae bacterium]
MSNSMNDRKLFRVTHITDMSPTRLKTAKETSEKLHVSEQDLIDLASTGYMPHYRINDGEPLFDLSESRKWVQKHLVTKCDGQNLPKATVNYSGTELSSSPPLEIASVDNLRESHDFKHCPCVYFLCDEEKVVYVGQTKNFAARITSHRNEKGDKFSRVFFIPVPESCLLSVESQYIRLLKPELNSVK